MAKRNGGIIGPANTPTSSVAAGVWRLRDAFNSIKNGTWPLVRSVATNSLRFNSGSSDYLNRTPSATSNQQKFTISTWVKLSDTSATYNNIASFGASSTTDGVCYIDINSSKQLEIFMRASATEYKSITTQLFRDYSAWYNIIIAVDTTQATSTSRTRVYVNGSEITAFSTQNAVPQNTNLLVNTSGSQNRIGASRDSGAGLQNYFNGYMSELNFIDGQQLTPSSFGASNSSGVWYPIPYQGTYGTNGFNLKFANSASLGTDSSGNANNFTVNNLTSVDQSTDTELNNFATFNSIKFTGGTLTEGNLKFDSSSASWKTRNSTIGVSAGKWFMEFKMGTVTADQGGVAIVSDLTPDGNFPASDATRSPAIAYNSEGKKWVNGTGTASYFATMTSSDVIGIALDMDNGTVQFYRNGSTTGSPINLSDAFTSANYPLFFAGALYNTRDMQANFGSPNYSANSYTDGAGYGNFSYAVPSGYYALCTKNLNTYG
jgi:hypothetical protein